MNSIFKDGMSTDLISGIKEILDSDLIGVDYKDVETVLNFENAIVYSAHAVGKDRASIAAKQTITNIQRENISLLNVQGILMSISANQSIKMWEVHKALDILNNSVSKNTVIVVGAVVRKNMNEALRVTIIATGLKKQASSNL